MTMTVTLISDRVFERDKTIAVTLLDSAAYVLGRTESATVTIVGDDFSESTLAAKVIWIKAPHFTELRNAIPDARTRHGLGAYAWTNHPLVSGSTPVKAVYLTETRTALSQAHVFAGKAASAKAEPIVAGGVVNARRLGKLRAMVLALG